jgi:hypothetical protein
MKTNTYAPTHLNRWTRPKSYMGAEWPEYFYFLGQNRDSNALTRSNFRCGLAALEKLPAFSPEDGETESRFVIREGHWACGWVEWVAIHNSDVEALKAADEMAAGLDSYPVLNESDFSDLEQEEADQTWQNCYDVKERLAYVRKFRNQFEFRDLGDVLACIRGKYFAGYASELLA